MIINIKELSNNFLHLFIWSNQCRAGTMNCKAAYGWYNPVLSSVDSNVYCVNTLGTIDFMNPILQDEKLFLSHNLSALLFDLHRFNIFICWRNKFEFSPAVLLEVTCKLSYTSVAKFHSLYGFSYKERFKLWNTLPCLLWLEPWQLTRSAKKGSLFRINIKYCYSESLN